MMKKDAVSVAPADTSVRVAALSDGSAVLALNKVFKIEGAPVGPVIVS
jgi:hypothetical protein